MRKPVTPRRYGPLVIYRWGWDLEFPWFVITRCHRPGLPKLVISRDGMFHRAWLSWGMNR